MTKHRRIYLLNPKDLSPEAIAVAFAKTSRSPKPIDEIASELTDEGASAFHEKWVIGYGHASVAEHAVLHFALENVSRLAVETIEGNRLASYTEKSSRYQQWDQDAYTVPEELLGSDLEAPFVVACNLLFQTYKQSIPRVERWLINTHPKQAGEKEKAFHQRIRGEAIDSCRFLLPAASLANVGMTINARALEYAICKMLSSPIKEVQAIGETLRKVGQKEAPTLVKYAACNPYQVQLRGVMGAKAQNTAEYISERDFHLVDWDKKGEKKVLAAILYRFSGECNFQTYYEYIQSLSQVQLESLASDIMAGRGKFDQPVREFEYASMTFDLLMDQGAYFEFKRHRMMTQTVQPLTPGNGFAVPKAISLAGCETDYLSAMRLAAEVYNQIATLHPDAASYILPNGFNRRVLCMMNLREFFNFFRLRAAKNAHFSIRRIARRMAEAVEKVYPILGAYLDRPEGYSWLEIEDQYFSKLAKF